MALSYQIHISSQSLTSKTTTCFYNDIVAINYGNEKLYLLNDLSVLLKRIYEDTQMIGDCQSMPNKVVDHQNMLTEWLIVRVCLLK